MNCIDARVLRGRTGVVVIGAGHSGLACSHYLARFGVKHVVIERGEIGEAWRSQRWDSLRLLTPNWQNALPGWRYRGDNPDGYMDRAGVVRFIEGFAAQCTAPVEQGTTVQAVEPCAGGYRVRTDRGDWLCMAIIVASGACARPNVPALSRSLPARVEQITTLEYRNPGQLQAGGVLVVGAAASGVQIARELRRAGHPVVLAVGEHVRMSRRYRGRDIQYWMHAAGLLDEDWRDVDDLRRVRRLPSPQLAGTTSGLDCDLNSMAAEGVELVGRLAGLDGSTAQFSGSLPNVAKLADLKLNRLLDRIDQWIAASGTLAAPANRPAPTRFDGPMRLGLDLGSGEIRTLLWATGYRPDYSWLGLPVLDEKGMPRHSGGVAALPGVYFMGLPFMRRRKSSFICGAGEDARDIVHHLLAYLGRPVDVCLPSMTA